MSTKLYIDTALRDCLRAATEPPCPERLAAAMLHGVFPGGARLRPRLILAVAQAFDTQPGARVSLALRAAAAIELLHCASLVQDDLPCFDDAALRRGKASVHKAFGERLSILASDGLIMLAYEHLSAPLGTAGVAADGLSGHVDVPHRVLADQLALVSLLGRQTGTPHGITAGQAWECEPSIDLQAYHQAKTGSLFAAATQAGALAAGCHEPGWDKPGNLIGLAYQIADDLHDVVGSSDNCGKPVGVDATLGRPNAVNSSSVGDALQRLHALIEELLDTLPDCPGRAVLIDTFRRESQDFVPKEIARSAA